MEEKELDIFEIIRDLIKNKKFIFKWAIIGLIAGIIIAFSIPKEYSAKTSLYPEIQQKTQNLGALSGLIDLDKINNQNGAFSPNLYLDVIKSNNFIINLLKINIESSDKKINTNLYSYIKDYEKSPWWKNIIKLPSSIIGLFTHKKNESSLDSINQFKLTIEEYEIINSLKNKINLDLDNKTSIATISVSMQDANIAAEITDSVMNNLQKFVIAYRTNKAVSNLRDTKNLYQEAKNNYYKSQNDYSRYLDANRSIVNQTKRAEEIRLENEYSLNLSLFNQVSQQLQAAKAKVNEDTPVFTILEPSSTPLIADKPKKKIIIIAFVFFAIVSSSVWILFLKDILAKLKSKK